MQHFIEPSPEIRLAASVILLRPGAMGVEAFVQHQASTMDFAAGMVVSPGGKTDSGDRCGDTDGEHPPDAVIQHAAAWHSTDIGHGGDDPARCGRDLAVRCATGNARRNGTPAPSRIISTMRQLGHRSRTSKAFRHLLLPGPFRSQGRTPAADDVPPKFLEVGL